MNLPAGSAGLMAMAIRYTLGSLPYVTPASLTGPTPCAAWDLAALLAHVSDSLAARARRPSSPAASALSPPPRRKASRQMAWSRRSRAPGRPASRRIVRGQRRPPGGHRGPAAGRTGDGRRRRPSRSPCTDGTSPRACPLPAARSRLPWPPASWPLFPLVVTEITRGVQFADPVAPPHRKPRPGTASSPCSAATRPQVPPDVTRIRDSV